MEAGIKGRQQTLMDLVDFMDHVDLVDLVDHVWHTVLTGNSHKMEAYSTANLES